MGSQISGSHWLVGKGLHRKHLELTSQYSSFSVNCGEEGLTVGKFFHQVNCDGYSLVRREEDATQKVGRVTKILGYRKIIVRLFK